MGSSDTQFCPIFRPTRAEFSKPFCEYVQDVCKQHPDVAMFKVVPPKGWSPRKKSFPQLDSLRIQTPIKQHVFGTGGAFRCLFEEQRALSVADFKKLSYSGSHKTPPKGHREDDLLERAFWSSVTINPPLYGADTPTSFFDEKLEFGWNLRDLRDLLTQYNVPPIPGVTTPMTYFGMWKSFFSWHVEDVDLYSINYLHFGAPKVWYCVSPKDRSKFEDMAKGLFPELHNICPAFMRHKDILLSPKTLRNHHINYVQAKQEAGEFVVLNAGAYHSGFNLGFNCAEAVNFATADWLTAGKDASHCTCTALPDHVHLDMKIFSRGPRVSQRLKALGELQDSDTEEESDSDSEVTSVSGNDDASEESGDESQTQPEPRPKPAARCRQTGPAAKPGQRKQPKSRPLNEVSKTAPAKTPQGKISQEKRSRKSAMPLSRQTKAASALAVMKGSKAEVSKGSKARKPSTQHKKPVPAQAAQVRQNPFASGTRSPALAKLAAARGTGSKRLAGQPAEVLPSESEVKRRRTAAVQPFAQTDRQEDPSDGTGPMRRAFEWVRQLMTGQQPNEEEIVTSPATTSDVLDDKPYAIVGEDNATGRKYFHLVQRLKRKPKRKRNVVVRWLREEADGIFRPTGEVWEEAESALVNVRSQPWAKSAHRPLGYRLQTLRCRILDTELVD